MYLVLKRTILKRRNQPLKTDEWFLCFDKSCNRIEAKHEKDSIEEGYANLESETYKFIYSSCLDGLIPS
jgi:hypothetical protein